MAQRRHAARIVLDERKVPKAGLMQAQGLPSRTGADFNACAPHSLEAIASNGRTNGGGHDVIIGFDELPDADLIPGAIYEAGPQNNLGADPLARLLPVGNQGGIRFNGPARSPRLVVLKTNWVEPEWPDHFDPRSGVLSYFGDNRRVGSPLSRPRGNQCLESQFGHLHAPNSARQAVAPTLAFETLDGRNVRFLGLSAPGVVGMSPRDDLIAFWSRTPQGEFMNYIARFTVWTETRVARSWLNAVSAGQEPRHAPDCPIAFAHWIDRGTY